MEGWVVILAAVGSAVAVVISSICTGYVLVTKGKADVRVITAKAVADEKLTDRDQIMKEYGQLLQGLRESVRRAEEDRDNLVKRLDQKEHEHLECIRRCGELEGRLDAVEKKQNGK